MSLNQSYPFQKVSTEFLVKFSNDWLIHSLTHSLTNMLSDKHNSITTKAMGLNFALFDIASSQNMPFYQLQQLQYFCHGSTKLTFVLLYTLFISPLPHRWQFVVRMLYKTLVQDLVKCSARIHTSYIGMLTKCLKNWKRNEA